MPLFGSKHNNKHDDGVEHNTLQKSGPGGGRHHETEFAGGNNNNYPAGTGMTGAPMGGSGGMNQTYPQHGGAGLSGQQGGQDQFAQGQYGHGPGSTGQGFHDNQFASGGGVGAGGPGAGGIPTTGMVNHGENTHNTGGAGTRLTGKVESAVGSMVGSNALKAKGLQKEQEANAVKLQGRELAEAERLEKEALMRRERAVGHGAHPANATLGAGSNN